MQKLKQCFLLVLILSVVVCYGCSWFNGDSNGQEKPTPTPRPTPKPKVNVTWDKASQKLLFDGKPDHVKGIGYYFIGEVVVELQKRPDYVEEWLTYLEDHDINYIRTFVESTFLKAELDAIGIPTRQIFKKNANGKYILTDEHIELDLEWVNAMGWLADRIGEHGMAWCLVLVDQCMHKCYGTDLYGWPTNQYNIWNNTFGHWEYDGHSINCNFFKYYNLWNWKYPHLLEVRQNVILTVCNMARNRSWIVLELTNEGAPEPAHIPYGNYPKFENWEIDLIRGSYNAVNKIPIICDSSDEDFVKNNIDFSWSHNFLEEGRKGMSTDGRRCNADGVAGFTNKISSYLAQGRFIEMHMAYMTKCLIYNGINADPMDVGALTWFGTWPVDMVTYDQYLGKWFRAIKNAPGREMMVRDMMINEYYDSEYDTEKDREIDGKKFPF